MITLWGCSQTKLAGGTGTETTNGIVVLTSGGVPAENAQVTIIDGATWYDSISIGVSPSVESLTVSQTGIIEPTTTVGTRTVQVQWADEVAIVEGDCDTIITSEGRTIRGYATGFESVYLGGTEFKAEIIGETFVVTNIPDGIYSLWCKADSTITLQERAIVESDTEIAIDEISTGSLLFDDFTGGFSHNPLETVSKGVLWYTVSDSLNHSLKDDIWIETNSNAQGNSSISALELDGAVRTNIFLGSRVPYPYAGIGVSLFGSSFQDGYDLSDMDSISIRIRGSGTTHLFLESEQLTELGSSHYGYAIDLTESWESVAVSVNDLHLLSKDIHYESIYPWSTEASNINRMEFLWRGEENSTDKNYWMEIDEIRFIGITFPY